MLLLDKHQTFKYIQEIKKKKKHPRFEIPLAIKEYENDMERTGGGILTAVLQICIMQMICMSNGKTN